MVKVSHEDYDAALCTPYVHRYLHNRYTFVPINADINTGPWFKKSLNFSFITFDIHLLLLKTNAECRTGVING